jgi:hemolysin D
MDTELLAADGRALSTEYHTKRLAMRRIEAELASKPLAREADDPPALFAQAQAQQAANVAAYRNALAQERSTLERARHDLAAANEVREKLLAVLPH